MQLEDESVSQSDFSYETASDQVGRPLAISIFSDEEIPFGLADDLQGMGFRVVQTDPAGILFDSDVVLLGDIVLVRCSRLSAEDIAAFARLDQRVSKSGSELIVMTKLDALDVAFAIFDQSSPQILVDAGRAELMVAIGRILGNLAGGRVRELSQEDRLALIRLSEQVDIIARRLENLRFAAGEGEEAKSQLGDRKIMFKAADAEDDALHVKGHVKGQPRAPLPDPRLVRQIIARRQARARFFDADLFADPAWDMLLDLTASHAEHGRVSVTSLCIASGVPATTALRWIRQMSESGLFERVDDSADRRRAFITLSDRAVDAMARYFAEVAKPALAYAA